ncbi:MAG: hypothetical protein RLZZ241_1711 [Bacteroidota bacterium]|jgi:gliding motility-associated lipoprotein GldH
MRKVLFIVGTFVALSACTGNLVFSESAVIPKGLWDKENTIRFTMQNQDTIQKHNVYFVIRNDNTFPYSNLFLIAEIKSPDGTQSRDTLEYNMADPQGNWLGSGANSSIENILGYKRDIVFAQNGVYTFTLSHAMRENGKVQGIASLPGIFDVGIQIEKNLEQ